MQDDLFDLEPSENAETALENGATCQRRESSAPSCSYPCQDGLIGKCQRTAHQSARRFVKTRYVVGTCFKINCVNGECLEDVEDKTVETSLIHGVDGKACV